MRFLPYQPRERLAEVQATADVSLVTLAPGRGRTSVPSKVMGYMAAGRPVVASVDSGCDTAREIEESGCGVVVPPGDPEALARAISDLLADEHRREQLGRAGRQRVEERYAKPVVLEKYRQVLEGLFHSREQGGAV
jgi:colanic acid biosynthesis glycosyl transferase WcaI